MGVFTGRAHGELVHVGLADEDGVGGAQPLDGRRVVGRNEVFEDFRAAGGAPAADAEDVLERQGNARQPPQSRARCAPLVNVVGLR